MLGSLARSRFNQASFSLPLLLALLLLALACQGVEPSAEPGDSSNLPPAGSGRAVRNGVTPSSAGIAAVASGAGSSSTSGGGATSTAGTGSEPTAGTAGQTQADPEGSGGTGEHPGGS